MQLAGDRHAVERHAGNTDGECDPFGAHEARKRFAAPRGAALADGQPTGAEDGSDERACKRGEEEWRAGDVTEEAAHVAAPDEREAIGR